MIEMFVERAAPGSVRGDHWRVSWYDRELRKFVGGAGPTPWKALAWALVNRVETKLDMIVIARNATDTPASVLAQLTRADFKPTTRSMPEFRREVQAAPVPTSAATRRSQAKRKKKAT